MKHLRHILIGILLLLTSCIENSIPYPVVTLQILGVEGEGFTCAPEDINTQERIVTLHLDEQTDISNVKIDKISVTENARSSKPLSGTFDLRTPLYITLSFYQDYEWTIVADQKIERYFEVESQIGAAEIDVDQLTAKAYVPEGTDLSDLKVTRLKLGPADITTMTPPIDELTSFESVRYVYVAYHDFEEKWSLYVEATDTKVRFTQVDAWSGVIWAYAEGNSADELGFRYRKTGDEAWTEVDKKQINISGGAFDSQLNAALKDFPHAVWSTYGMTETLSHIALRRLNGPEASDWYTPFESIQIRLSKENTLVIYAPEICEKELVTNDIAEINGQNQFRILGRKDNTINTGGVKVQIEQVEAALKEHLSVPFLITSAPDEKFGEIIVLLAEGQLPDDIEQTCTHQLPPYWRPKRFVPVFKLPLTETGKPDRAIAKLLAQK